MHRILFNVIIVAAAFSGKSCQKEANSRAMSHKPVSYRSEFNDYWYAGVAEVSTYKLEQVRYGEVHRGKATMIFVTEPFSVSRQVKLDDPAEHPDDNQSVLKLNFIKKFTTGIYPYSMMLSAFTPVETNRYPYTPKVTMSSQEWCGHVFSQLNLKKNRYQLFSFSYFEKEGDVKKDINKELSEDELWNRIRLDHKRLPLGSIKIIPGLFYSRMTHKELRVVTAFADIEANESTKTYTLVYPEDRRELKVTFETDFPHKILAWEEQTPGSNGKPLVTRASLDKTLLIDYWSRNKVADSYLRDSLNLE